VATNSRKFFKRERQERRKKVMLFSFPIVFFFLLCRFKIIISDIMKGNGFMGLSSLALPESLINDHHVCNLVIFIHKKVV